MNTTERARLAWDIEAARSAVGDKTSGSVTVPVKALLGLLAAASGSASLHKSNTPLDDDFGDASIRSAMDAARERGDMPTENKSRLHPEGSPS